MCLRFVFLLITRLAAWVRLSRREETWKTAEIFILRHQLAVLQRRQAGGLRPGGASWRQAAASLSGPGDREPGTRQALRDRCRRWLPGLRSGRIAGVSVPSRDLGAGRTGPGRGPGRREGRPAQAETSAAWPAAGGPGAPAPPPARLLWRRGCRTGNHGRPWPSCLLGPDLACAHGPPDAPAASCRNTVGTAILHAWRLPGAALASRTPGRAPPPGRLAGSFPPGHQGRAHRAVMTR